MKYWGPQEDIILKYKRLDVLCRCLCVKKWKYVRFSRKWNNILLILKYIAKGGNMIIIVWDTPTQNFFNGRNHVFHWDAVKGRTRMFYCGVVNFCRYFKNDISNLFSHQRTFIIPVLHQVYTLNKIL